MLARNLLDLNGYKEQSLSRPVPCRTKFKLEIEFGEDMLINYWMLVNVFIIKFILRLEEMLIVCANW